MFKFMSCLFILQLDALARSHPYNPLWAQLGLVYYRATSNAFEIIELSLK